MRPYLYAAIALAVLGAALWLYSRGADNARTDQLERTLDDADTFNEGAGTHPECRWIDRLRDECPAD